MSVFPVVFECVFCVDVDDQAQSSRTEKIYRLLQSKGNRMKLSELTLCYRQQFGEALPMAKDNGLLKYLVQLPRILVIKCLSEDDIGTLIWRP